MSSYKLQTRNQYLVKFAYAGCNYRGLQPQINFATAGGDLSDHIEKISGQKPFALVFAARTDKGVHAHDSIATFRLREKFDFGTKNINRQNDTYIKSIKSVHYKTHARGISNSKVYRYIIEDSCSPDFLKNQKNHNDFTWQIAPKIDINKLKSAASCLVGEHDFSSFRFSKCEAGNPTKNLYSLKIVGPIKLENQQNFRNQYHLIFHADGYLRKMIRNIVGLLVEMATGLKDPADMPQILESKNRYKAGMTAPAIGLVLHKIITEKSLP